MAVLKNITIGVIGSGNMGEALIRGCVDRGVVEPLRLIASDILEERLELVGQEYGVLTTTDNLEVLRQADLIILAVKPDVCLAEVLPEIGAMAGADKLIISVVAGVTSAAMAARLTGGCRIIRTIPNTPAMVLEGATCLAEDSPAGPRDMDKAEAVFRAIGRTVRLKESLIDAATGLSGSGPAYGFIIIEALADGGVKMGLTRAAAQELAAQTLLGAAKMVLESGRHPGRLKDQVASPGGTTIAGLHQLEQGGLRAALINAVQAATLRSAELGKED